jgi:hypothetical protein
MKTEEVSAVQLEQIDTTVNSSAAEKDYTQHPSHDVATQLVDTVVAGDITHEEDKSALRRIDCVLMPVMFVSFALQYMDKSCLTGAALFGILTDLDLVKL